MKMLRAFYILLHGTILISVPLECSIILFITEPLKILVKRFLELCPRTICVILFSDENSRIFLATFFPFRRKISAPRFLASSSCFSMAFQSSTVNFLVKVPQGSMETVSYTHLTLPTKDIRCRSRWSPYH